MLPLQGQGASQSIEDAEAIVAYLGGCSSATSVADIRAALKVSTVEVKLDVRSVKWRLMIDSVHLGIGCTRCSYRTGFSDPAVQQTGGSSCNRNRVHNHHHVSE